jgi:hypothetical protein
LKAATKRREHLKEITRLPEKPVETKGHFQHGESYISTGCRKRSGRKLKEVEKSVDKSRRLIIQASLNIKPVEKKYL